MFIKSLLDNDIYKLYMMQAVYNLCQIEGDIDVSYKFTHRNTNQFKLGTIINPYDLQEQLENITCLTFTDDEIQYLADIEVTSFDNKTPTKVFSHEFIRFLEEFDPLIHMDVSTDYTGELVLLYGGTWLDSILFEVPFMATISEIYTNHVKSLLNTETRNLIQSQARYALEGKIALVKGNRSMRVSDFGTRRRSSFEWQDYVIERLVEAFHGVDGVDTYQFSGTSNVYFAKKYGITPIGTFAHEMPMVMAGIRQDLYSGYMDVLNTWKRTYGNALSTCLPDTFTSDWFLNNIGDDWLENWAAIRHDSGDPIGFGEKVIKFIKNSGVDPMTKTIVFSDGLSFDKAEEILEHFRGKIWCAFGIGTNLTNDVGIKPLNIVIKADKAGWKYTNDMKPLVKLSDEMGKYTGDKSEIERYLERIKE